MLSPQELPPLLRLTNASHKRGKGYCRGPGKKPLKVILLWIWSGWHLGKESTDLELTGPETPFWEQHPWPSPLSPLSFKKVQVQALGRALQEATSSFLRQDPLSLCRCFLWLTAGPGPQALWPAASAGGEANLRQLREPSCVSRLGPGLSDLTATNTWANIFSKPFQGQKTIWSALRSCESTLWNEKLTTCRRWLLLGGGDSLLNVLNPPPFPPTGTWPHQPYYRKVGSVFLNPSGTTCVILLAQFLTWAASYTHTRRLWNIIGSNPSSAICASEKLLKLLCLSFFICQEEIEP